MPPRESRLWGFQKKGAHAFWDKVDDWRRRNGEPPTIWGHVAKELGISEGALSEWRARGRLPPVDYCFDLARRMRMSVPDLLDPSMPYDPEPADLRQRAINALLSGPRERVERILRVSAANPRALDALATLDTDPRPRR